MSTRNYLSVVKVWDRMNKVGIVLLGLLIMSGCSSNKTKLPLQGTYTCDDLSFVTMVFDLEDHYTFYYDDLNKNDKGTDVKNTDTEYVLNSQRFNDIKISYDSDEKTFEIFLNGTLYHFHQISTLPTLKIT